MKKYDPDRKLSGPSQKITSPTFDNRVFSIKQLSSSMVKGNRITGTPEGNLDSHDPDENDTSHYYET